MNEINLQNIKSAASINNDALLAALLGGGGAALAGWLGASAVNKKTETPEERRKRILLHTLGWSAAGTGIGGLTGAGLNLAGISISDALKQIYSSIFFNTPENKSNYSSFRTSKGVMIHDPNSTASAESVLARFTPSQALASPGNLFGLILPGWTVGKGVYNRKQYEKQKDERAKALASAYMSALDNIASNKNSRQPAQSISSVIASNKDTDKIVPSLLREIYDPEVKEKLFSRFYDITQKHNQSVSGGWKRFYVFDPNFDLAKSLPAEAISATTKARNALENAAQKHPVAKYKMPWTSAILTGLSEIVGQWSGQRVWQENARSFIEEVKNSNLPDAQKIWLIEKLNGSVNMPKLWEALKTLSDRHNNK